MPSYLHPGVYLEEIASGSRPIEGVATSVTAFVGFTYRGEVGAPKLIGKFDDYVNEFGPIVEDDPMGLAVRAFYLNGGGSAYVCRLAGPNTSATNTEDILGEDSGINVVLTITASSPGVWGDKIRYKIEKASATARTFSLVMGEFNDEFVELERFDDLSMDKTSTDYVAIRVNDNSQLVTVKDTAIAADYQNATIVGNTSPSLLVMKTYIDDVSKNHNLMISVNGSDMKLVSLAGVRTDSLANLTSDIQSAIDSALANNIIDFTRAANKFTIATNGTPSSSDNITLIDSEMLSMLALASGQVTSVKQGADKVIPQAMPGTIPVADAGELLGGGQDTHPVATDFTTFYNTTLRKFRDVSIIVVPGSSWDGGLGQANLSATLAHCESMKNRVLIIDPPNDTELATAPAVSSLALPTSTYSVLYYPWVDVANPLYHPDKAPLAAKNITIAPSAIAAGMWAKTDGKRGVWKAPAGVASQLTGTTGLEFIVEDLEQNQLNPLGINCIRKLPNYGSVFWGSRTLATKADPEWRYVPVRRTAIFIEESIYNGIQWAVFEPNAHPLWSSLRANIGSFMNGMFRAGAFQGQTANDAYFVRCGLGDTMTQGDIDSGQVIVVVGFAPVKPAEFVIVRIQQIVGEV